jgi:predicted amidohydrolase YtcJ
MFFKPNDSHHSMFTESLITFMKKILFFIALAFSVSCNNKPEADAIYYNGKIYTVDSSFSIVEAMAVKDGKILATGTSAELMAYDAPVKMDLKGKCVYPGFIDAHCHFYGYSMDLKKIVLTGSHSFEEILDTLTKNKDQLFMGWLFGRGWDQNDWVIKEFPDREKLDSLFPDMPVFLMRIDGHAALVNSKALEIAGITQNTKVAGGEIIIKNGKVTGLLIDNAVDLVKNKIPEPSDEYKKEALLKGQRNCFEVGLTTVDDAGLESHKIELIEKMQIARELKMRVYAMITCDSSNRAYYYKKGKIKTDWLNVRSFKVYADGALGSRGAALMQPYSDQHNHNGFLLSEIDSIKRYAKEIAEYGFQLNTHCIGDSANRLLLNIYKEVLNGDKSRRWRIEHAQVVDTDDFNLFGENAILPSVQPTHATSDMYWATERLGNDRIKGAYAYQDLLKQNGMIALGSDFPVEDINPLFGFYAAVVRKDRNLFPAEGFQMNNALSREQALKAMTIWAAYSNFEENEKGSIETGKFADFVILDDDIMTCAPEKIFKVKVQSTYSGGEKVF